MLRVVVIGMFVTVLFVGIVIVAVHSASPDCMGETVIVGGHPYQVSTCR